MPSFYRPARVTRARGRRVSLALEKGLIADSHVRGELGELLTGKRQGRTSDDQLTLFRSLGLAVEDLTAAEYVLEERRKAELE
jgi:ornithine cyclodeaminase